MSKINKVNEFITRMEVNGKIIPTSKINDYLSDIIPFNTVFYTYHKKTKMLCHKESVNLIISYGKDSNGEDTVTVLNTLSTRHCCIEYLSKGQGHCLYRRPVGESTGKFLSNCYQLALEDSSKKEQENQIIFAFILGALL